MPLLDVLVIITLNKIHTHIYALGNIQCVEKKPKKKTIESTKDFPKT